MNARTRRWLFHAIRLAICVVALWFVLRGVSLRDRVALKADRVVLEGQVTEQNGVVSITRTDGIVRSIPSEDIARDKRGAPRITYGLITSLRTSDKSLLLLALLIHAPVAFLQGVRLRTLLGIQQIDLSYWDCIRLSFAGNFLNFATPLGSNAGDVFKAYFVTTHTNRKTEAATTIVIDRAIGLTTLLASVALILTIVRSDTRLAEFRPYVLAFLGIGVLAAIAYLSPITRRHVIPWKKLTRMRIFAQLQRIDQAARALTRNKGAVAWAVTVTLLLQILAIGAYFTVAVAMGLRAHAGNVLEYYAYFYTGAVVQSLPGPPQGLGTVELAYRYFLEPFGSPSQILCVAFLVRIVVLVHALPGLFITLTGSYRPNAEVAHRIASGASPLVDPSKLPSSTDAHLRDLAET